METYYSVENEGTWIKPAPDMLWPNLRRPTKEEYNAKNYWTFAGNAPEPPEGQQVSKTTYVRNEGDDFITAVYEYEDIPATVRKWTRLSIIRTLVKKDLFEQVSAELSEMQRKQFYACDYILENDEMAVEVIKLAREKFGDETVDAILDSIPVEA